MMLWLAAPALADAVPERETSASCYGEEHRGMPTASGDPFDPDGFTTAHKTLPFGTPVLVRMGDASAVFTVNDRGPYARDREFDLACGAMSAAFGVPGGVYPIIVS